MPVGDDFTPDQHRSIARACQQASASAAVAFHVFVGPAGEEPRAEAVRLHGRLEAADRAVLVLVDPRAHALEIVTGREARRTLDDSACGLAALSMQTAFAAGDITGGLVHGLHQLADHARRPATLHTDQP